MLVRRAGFLLGLALVACGAAAFAVGFRGSLAWLYATAYRANSVVSAMTSLPGWLRLAVPAAGGLVAGLVARWRQGAGQGVSNVMEAVALGHLRLSLRTTLSRVLSSWAAIAAGMSIGREGPLIEFGGSLGSAVGRAFRMSTDQARVLVAAGTSAGFAAAYNTPFSAVLFVFETIAGVAAPALILPVMVATVVATTITRTVAGGGPIYGQRTFTFEPTVELFSFAGLAVLAAVAASAFKAVLEVFERFVDRHPVSQPFRSAFGGVLVGSLIVFWPQVAGNGYEPLNLILDGRMAVAGVLVLMAAKIVATGLSVASGVPGGIFTPTLLVGASLGTVWARAAASFLPIAPDPGSYALVGMAAATAASIHAPLTAAVLVFELSGDYLIVVPLMLVTVMATAVSRRLGAESVYEAELRRRGLGWEFTLDGRRVIGGEPHT